MLIFQHGIKSYGFLLRVECYEKLLKFRWCVMAPEVISRDGGSNRQYANDGNGAPHVSSRHLDLGCGSCIVSKRVLQFPKHDTVKLNETNFLL